MACISVNPGLHPGLFIFKPFGLASKAALDAITLSLSKERGAKNVRINSILPGATETEGAASAGVTPDSEYEKMFVANTPLGRRGRPEDIAKAVVFLASDDADWIRGEQISVSGVCMVFRFVN